MIKFIIEVSEQYIRDHADAKKMTDKVEGKEGNSAIKMLLDMMAYSSLEKEVDKGQTEFTITQDNVDEKCAEIFDHAMGEVVMLAKILQKDSEKSDE